ncbi:unsaturated chondroitin disaccharide hydrolase [Enterococcus sp. AZ194]|uniref:glycoside hydrolase family 88 protein n=1 Tax=Enterococcus sp. AZ194 TaxID=2774629 RepID=UPI003F29BFD4
MKATHTFKERLSALIQQEILPKINDNLKTYKTTFPSPNSENLIYEAWENIEWTPGFWTGMLWHAYQITNDEIYLNTLYTLLPTFKDRMDNQVMLTTHDIGFIYGLSTYPAYLLVGNQEYKDLTIQAGNTLMQRYNRTANVFQAWGKSNDLNQQGRLIVDSLLNMPLLFQVSKLTGNPMYAQSAKKHIQRCAQFLMREDYSTYHTYYFDTLTGRPRFGKTAQGKSDDSTWARGQAWAVLGFALNFTYTKDLTLLEKASQAADYYLTKLPEDLVPYWDLSFQEGEEPRDSSAAAILVCGLLELSNHLPLLDEKRTRYEEFAIKIMSSLIDTYTTKGLKSTGILNHGVYSVPHGNGVDECCIWGDYFFFEAALRMSENILLFW